MLLMLMRYTNRDVEFMAAWSLCEALKDAWVWKYKFEFNWYINKVLLIIQIQGSFENERGTINFARTENTIQNCMWQD